MRESEPRIVVNTGPLLALVAATGGLDVLRGLYSEVLVPREVHAEILAGGADGFGNPTSRPRPVMLADGRSPIRLDKA
jgi:hypothetical protein